MHQILNIGHRGAKGYLPENTLASFQKALDLGVDGVELDVHLSSDGEIIVIHDETIDRTTGAKGFVNALSLRELKGFPIENELEIPTLAEVFDLINQQCFINVELKGNGTAAPVVKLIENYISEKNWNYEDIIVSGFDWNALQEVAHLNPKIRIGILTATDLELAIGFAEFIHAYAVHPYFHLLTAQNTIQMQQKGFRVFPWTVNESEDLQKIKSFRVDGIITDFPDRL
ncbi:MAG TPA: glycerophosphodiester phosphodiesterase family protein [Flavobacterium sp.]|nr:glycerophosphodiester phosphodiesterase family protein [Flavobacterium sp.]